MYHGERTVQESRQVVLAWVQSMARNGQISSLTLTTIVQSVPVVI